MPEATKPKKADFSEWYNYMLEAQDIIDLRYPVKGMPVYRGWGFGVLRNCFRMLEDALDAAGHQQMLFPLLVPDDLFEKEAEHIKGFGAEVFWVTHGGSELLERKLALRPTSETIIYPMFALWTRSHADFPMRVHQTCCVYRHETKATKPLVRGREVYWNEAHTAHASFEDAEQQVRDAMRVYGAFFASLGIPFLALKRPEHDKFAGAHHSIAFDALMPDGKALQIATVHHLGDNFAKAFGISYSDATGAKRFAHNTCYGISMRCLAALMATHGDDKGLVIPPAVAPLQVVIVPILLGEARDEVQGKCRELLALLNAAAVRARIDERDVRPGEKFYHWEGRGVPLRIEIGPKDVAAKQAVLVRRDTGEKKKVGEKEIAATVRMELDAIAKNLLERASANLEAQKRSAKNIAELKKIIDAKAGFVKIFWCARRECADELKAATAAEIRGSDGSSQARGKCVVCGGNGGEYWVAKAY
jgi:prolyl-tRNA synthetase